MVDPVTPTQLYSVPLTGTDVGTWGPVINANFAAIDGSKGGVVTVSLTNAPVTLTAPSGSTTPGAGPTQSQNGLIVFSGTLTGNCVITFPLPGRYDVLNNCVVGAFYVQLSGGSGNKIGIPPGQAVSVFSNGTNMQFVSLPPVGSYWDYAGSTVPAWITACTVAPWKVCDGATLQISDWPQLYAIIGAAYGGNGLTTFAVPDLRNRYRIPLDTSQGGFTSRITAAVSGINGQTLGAAGGDQNMQQHLHANTATGVVNQSGLLVTNGILDIPTTSGGKLDPTVAVSNPTVDVTMTNVNAGSGASQNIPPGLVAGLSFIRVG